MKRLFLNTLLTTASLSKTIPNSCLHPATTHNFNQCFKLTFLKELIFQILNLIFENLPSNTFYSPGIYILGCISPNHRIPYFTTHLLSMFLYTNMCVHVYIICLERKEQKGVAYLKLKSGFAIQARRKFFRGVS